jgi:serine/threonine protein kinase
MSRWTTGQIPVFPAPGGSVQSPRGASYLLGDLMGEGSFGAVFDCLGPFDQPFALKLFRPGERPYSEVRAEWQKEAERLYRLRHPNVVYVFDYFEFQGLFYLVLERCDHSLSDMLGRPFTDRLVVDMSRQILFALQYLSDSEIIHNDLHAGNILVVQGDELTLKLSDLGIAQELSGQRAVRPLLVQHRIMAPELVAGGYTTKQSDLYQLGLLMYEMHTGEYPLDTVQGYEAMLQQIKEGVPRLKAEALGTPIGNIVSVLLRRNEQYRYTSPAQVWEELRRLDVWADVPRGVSKTMPPGEVMSSGVVKTEPPKS